MFGSIGMPELIIIFVIALIIFGPRSCPNSAVRSARASRSSSGRRTSCKSTLEEEIRLEEQRATSRRRAAAGAGQRPPAAAAHDRRDRVPARRTSTRARKRPVMALVPFPGPQSAALPSPSGRRRRQFRPRGKMSFLEHLDELRKRIVNSVHRHRASASSSASGSSTASSTSSWRRRGGRCRRA